MTRSSKIWRVAGAAFVLINVGGAGWAIAMGEPMHAVVHAALLLGGYLVWRLVPGAGQHNSLQEQQAEPRLEYLQQSVDAIALEVERIGEAQRFNDKLRAERVENPEREP